MHKRLYSYLQGNNILYRYQFGFRKNHSTALALIDCAPIAFKNIYIGREPPAWFPWQR